tara:strand:+ start:43579 stop:45096 length:1518 start_codon:yes stop_codon:yes gene_type:complete
MRQTVFSIITFFVILLLFPLAAFGFLAEDFKVNNQPIYDVPPGTSQVLILDLTLPEVPSSITLRNAGVLIQSYISKLVVYEDGSSAGWDGDEREVAIITIYPFFEKVISGSFSKQRIFVTADISSSMASGSTVKPKIAINSVEFTSGNKGPTDLDLLGLERKIVVGANVPTIPLPPFVKNGEAISTSTIRWHFLDLTNNEFGFRILDSSLKTVAESQTANLSYLDETGLEGNTKYSGRRVYAFNDRGATKAQEIFSEIYTLVAVPTLVEKAEATKTSVKVKAVGVPTNLVPNSTGLYFENYTTGTNSGWIKENSWTSLYLVAGTEYTFRVKARNGDGKETAFSELAELMTVAEVSVEEPVVEESVIVEITVSELRAQINALMAQLATLQAQLSDMGGSTGTEATGTITGVPVGFTFENTLKQGMSDNEVMYLQIVLNSDSNTQVAASGVGSLSNETTYFGSLTNAAVVKFQEKYAADVLATYGLTSGTGLVGSTTRDKLNEILGK